MQIQKVLLCAAATVLFGVTGQCAHGQISTSGPGQPIPSPYPPGYNPYLQLINPGGSFTSNYFNLVYPQVQIANNFQQLQQQNINTRRGMELQRMNPVATTSSKVGFNTHSKYFGSGSRNFGVNNTTNSNLRPPVSDERLLQMMYRPAPLTGSNGKR